MLFSFTENKIEAGVDEAGRGPIAGPVVAAAVILPAGFFDVRLRDSKKMKERDRIAVAEVIREQAVAYGVGSASEAEIDQINILQATFLAVNRAITALCVRPELLLVDGNRFKTDSGIEYECIVGGDDKYMSIAAASVLAKTVRDEYMARLGVEFPQYDWAINKGYPTPAHKAAVALHGRSPHHRASFKIK